MIFFLKFFRWTANYEMKIEWNLNIDDAEKNYGK
jgi:hypothetical protein